MLRLNGVSKTYRTKDGTVRALDNLSLEIPRGATQGVIGFSGAGKSTLVRCITGLERPGSGSISLEGVNLSRLRGRRLRNEQRRIGVIYQGYQLLSSRTALTNVALPLELAGVQKRERTRRALELLDWVGLADRAGSYPAQLSGGQRQRVAIARALVSDPSLLLCDEPTSALDPETTASILRLISRVRAELGLTVLLISHDLTTVRAVCERVAVLDAGQIVEEGETSAVFEEPSSAAGQRLLGVAA